MQKKSLKELGIKTYEPHKSMEIKKEKAMPILSHVGMKLTRLGGLASVIPTLIFSTIKGFFVAKRKIREVQMKNEKVLDLRRNVKRRLSFR